jgi:hypothetical protein
MCKTKPKFKTGQIVIMNDHKGTPFRIIESVWNSGWFYKWNKNNAAAESMIRELTAEEKG